MLNRFRSPYSTTNNNYRNNHQFDPERKRAKRETIAIVINAFLAVLTFVAIIISNKATNIANQSLEYAKGRDTTNDKKEKENAILASIKYSKDTARANSSLKEAVKSTTASIKLANQSIESLKDEQQRFEKQNQPYLQMVRVAIDSAVAGKKLYIMYEIENITHIPVKILSHRMFIDIEGNTIKRRPFFKLSLVKVGSYLIKENPLKRKVYSSQYLTTTEADLINNDRSIILYITDETIYENGITEKLRYYKAVIKLLYDPNRGCYNEFIENKNFN